MSLSLADVDLKALSEHARDTLQRIAVPIAEGESIENLVDELGLTRRAINDRLDELAAELRNQTGGAKLPKLSPAEYEALRDSIARYGLVYPIVEDAGGNLVDGHNRLRACEELGISPYRMRLADTLTDDERRSLALVVNVARRQLPASARRGIALAELVRDPSRSDRAIALAVGMSPTTIGELRRSLEESEQLSRVDSRRGRDRRERRMPAVPRGAFSEARERAETPPPQRSHVLRCPECGHEFDPRGA